MDTKIAKILDYQARQITYNVYTYYKTRKQDKGSSEHREDTNIIELVSNVTGLSKSSVTRIIREGNAMKHKDGVVNFAANATKVKHVRKKRIQIDENTEGIIRRKVIQFYTVMNEVPSVRKLNMLLAKENILKCSVEYLRQLLHKLGFTNEDNEGGIMMERPDIALDRLKYLQRIRIFRQSNCSIFFLSETAFWNLNSKPNEITKEFTLPTIIVVHMSGGNGFLDSQKYKTIMIAKPKKKNSESVVEERHSDFKWIKEILLPNIPAKSVIVMDGPPCEIKDDCDPPPTHSATTRASMQDWLKKNNIPFQETATKEHLADIIKSVFTRRQLAFDNILIQSGHSVVHLPAKHTDLNPTRMVWEKIRSGVKKSQKTSAMTLLVKYPVEQWQACFEKVKATEDEYYEHDMKMDDAVDSVKMAIKEEKNAESTDEDNHEFESGSEEDIDNSADESMECGEE